MAIAHKTKVGTGANHKVTYEYRSLLGIIGSWEEIHAEQVSRPSIFIETTTPDFDKVVINGEEYKKCSKTTQS